MDSGTIITTIILLAACVLPFIFINIRRKKKEKKLLQSLHQFAENKQANITAYEVWGNAAVGLDEKTRKAFFLKINDEKPVYQHVDLNEIKHCRILKTGKNAEIRDSDHKVVETIELAFIPEANYATAETFEFYNTAHDGFALKGELQIAEKWAGLLNEKSIAANW